MNAGHLDTLDIVQDEAVLRAGLLRAIGRIPADGTRASGTPRVHRVEIPVEITDPFAWLQAQPFPQKFFWEDRHGRVQTAAVGMADEVASDNSAALDVLAARLKSLPAGAARYIGGMRFDAARPASGEWASFPTLRFVLPRFELVVEDGAARLACNVLLTQERDPALLLRDEIARLRLPADALQGRLPLPDSRADVPGEDEWADTIAWALDRFTEGSLGKVVFARRATFGFAEPIDPLLLLKQLRHVTPGCFHFCFQFEDGAAFIGATPERLFFREGDRVLSEAVAGTRPRGESVEDDARFRAELLGSSKEQLEHAYVQRSIEKALRPLSAEVLTDARPSEMVLARGRHLHSRVQARLQKNVSDEDVIRALHPTPAVGGHPTQAALEAIRARETFDRGWYAGPVGWMGAEAAEFAVGIRSGLVRGRELSLYSGAGIVPGSVAEAEYAEVEQKISDFMRVLGLDQRRA